MKKLTGIFLAAVILSGTLLQHVSAAELVRNAYISEISVGSRAELEANGFTVSSTPVNGLTALSTGQSVTTANIDSAFSDSDCIGYKTTYDRSKAITDVKIMHMNGGFQEINMSDFVNENADGVAETIDIVFASLEEFRENYKNGSRPAELAYQTLNYLDVPQPDGSEDIPLGDYLLSEARTRDDIRDIMLLADTVVVNYIKNQLILGVADDVSANTEGKELTDAERAETPDLAELSAYTWLDRLVNNGTFEENIDDEAELNSLYTEYDKSYYQQTLSVINSIRNFAAEYREAEASQGTAGQAAENASDAEEKAEAEGTEAEATEIIEGSAEGNQAAEDMNVLILYNYLDQRNEDGTPVYFYGTKADGSVRSFAEFLIEVGEMDPETEDEEARHLLYPLFTEQGGLTPMTEGQWSILRISDFSTFLMSTVLEQADYAAMAKNVNAEGDKLLAANGTERLSVWYGVDYEFYKNGGSIYMTSQKLRLDAANKQYDLLTKKTYTEDELTNSQIAQNVLIGLGCAAATTFAVAQILLLVQKHIITSAVAATATTTATTAAGTSSVIAGSCAGLATALSAFMVITAVLVVCVLIAWLVYLFMSKEEEEEAAKEETVTMLPIPEYLLDKRQSGSDTFVNFQYKAVCAPGTDTPQNLNRIYDNTPWVVLYTTTDPDAGEPLSVTNDDGTERDPFVYTTNATETVDSYCAATMFEEWTAGNLKGESAKGGGPVFLWFHRVNDAAAPENFSEGKYILEVKLSSAGTAQEARDAIRNLKGFTLLDYNLTSDMPGVYTYLGYSTTDNASYALRDLRFAYSAGVDKKNGQIAYGGCTYSVYGYVGELLLCGSISESSGTPILAGSLKITETLGAAGAGYEPVNLFSGGPALDVNSCGSWSAGTGTGAGNEFSLSWNSHSYIYFLPETAYTGGTEYIGGLSFFGTSDSSEPSVPDGWIRLSDADVGGNQDGAMYLYYSVTFNPYRALTDVKYYQAEPNAAQVAYNLSYGSEGSYVAADVYQQGTQLYDSESGIYSQPLVRLLRASHSYRSNLFYEGGGYYESVTADSMRRTSEGNKASMEYSLVTYTDGSTRVVGTCIRCTALYLRGPVSGKEPLKVGELIGRSSSDYDSSSETPVRNFTDAYAETGANIGYQGAGGNVNWSVQFDDVWWDAFGHKQKETCLQTYKLEEAANYSSLYLFIERADPCAEREKLVKSVTVSYAGNDRNTSGTRSNYGAKFTVDDGNDQTDDTHYDTPYDTVCYDLFQNGPGQLVRMNLASGAGGSSESKAVGVLPDSDWDAWAMGSRANISAENLDDDLFDRILENITMPQAKPCIDSDYSTEVAYLWVTYTNTTSAAVSDLLIYETTVPAEATDKKNFYVTADAAVQQKAELCGEGWKADPASDTWYYLYAVYNNGHQVKELLVDDDPMTCQYKTVLNSEFKCSGSNRYFLKTKNIKSKLLLQEYLYTVATGEGQTSREAKIDLLNAGCSEYIPFNVTTTEGLYSYLGYNTTTTKKKAYVGFLLYNTGRNESAVTLDYGYIHFDVLSGDLNRNVTDFSVYLFGTRDTLFSDLYQSSGTRYAKQICCYPGTDLNEYAQGLKSTESITDSALRAYTESLIQDDDGDPVYWAQVNGVGQQVMKLNLGDEYLGEAAGNRLDMYMYVHYSDNYCGTTNVTETGSVFAGKSLAILIGGGSAILLSFIAVLFLRRRKRAAAD